VKTLIVGLGNPLLGDDGVGWVIAEQLQQRIDQVVSSANGDIEVTCLAVGGLSLMEHLIGYDRVILIDAINTGQRALGNLFQFPLDRLPNQAFGHMCSAHDTTLQNALEVGRRLGARLTGRITIVGIETNQIYDFSEELSPPVAASVPKAVQVVLDLIQNQE
jgi:hydrogenase maturation protease